MADTANFIPWLEWSTERVWLEHSNRLNGLFDPGYVKQLSSVLDVSVEELHRVWKLSCDPAELIRRRKIGDSDPEFLLMRRAYITSALIRGRFHDDVARRSGWQIMHHPFRESVLSGATSMVKAEEIEVSNTEKYIANILLASAYKQRSKFRVSAWVENVIRVRRAVTAGAIDTRSKDSDSVALDVAIRDVRELSIDFRSKYLDVCLGASASLGLSGYTTMLAPWVGFGISAATILGTAGLKIATDRRPELTQLAPTNQLARRKRKLKVLANAGPGQIRRIW
ncbi:hypothetical protein ACXPWS_05060 [Mycobacterium sp. BMJ-28]